MWGNPSLWSSNKYKTISVSKKNPIESSKRILSHPAFRNQKINFSAKPLLVKDAALTVNNSCSTYLALESNTQSVLRLSVLALNFRKHSHSLPILKKPWYYAKYSQVRRETFKLQRFPQGPPYWGPQPEGKTTKWRTRNDAHSSCKGPNDQKFIFEALSSYKQKKIGANHKYRKIPDSCYFSNYSKIIPEQSFPGFWIYIFLNYILTQHTNRRTVYDAWEKKEKRQAHQNPAKKVLKTLPPKVKVVEYIIREYFVNYPFSANIHSSSNFKNDGTKPLI